MENNQYKEKLRKFVDDSNLDENQKLLWGLFLKISQPDEDEAVFEAASEAPENLKLLTKYLRDKIWDMRETNIDAWHKLTAGEEKYAEIL